MFKTIFSISCFDDLVSSVSDSNDWLRDLISNDYLFHNNSLIFSSSNNHFFSFSTILKWSSGFIFANLERLAQESWLSTLVSCSGCLDFLLTKLTSSLWIKWN